jgi:alanyl-tRNA synthetase
VAEEVSELRQRVRQLEREGTQPSTSAVDLDVLLSAAEDHDGVPVLVSEVSVPDAKALPDLADRIRGRLGDGVIVLASAGEDRVALVASVAPSAVARGVRAGEVVKAAAAVVGGGGGGRDTMAQAGGRDVEKLPQALAQARATIEASLGQND